MPEPIQLAIMIMLLLPVVVLPVIALIDVIRSQFASSNQKLKWILLIIFTGFIGSIIYYQSGVKKKITI